MNICVMDVVCQGEGMNCGVTEVKCNTKVVWPHGM